MDKNDEKILEIIKKNLVRETTCTGQGCYEEAITLNLTARDYLGKPNEDYEEVKKWLTKGKKTMKAILINVIKEEAKVINVEDYPNYMDYINGEIFDIMCKKIGNKYYDMIYTDLGEVLILNSDKDGVAGLKDIDIDRIRKCYCEVKSW